jgi:hypothetical protein
MPSRACSVRRFDESKSTARKEKKMDLIKLTISFYTNGFIHFESMKKLGRRNKLPVRLVRICSDAV